MTLFNGFSLILGIGASFGLFQIALDAPRAQRREWLLAGLFSLLGALAGARLGYVLLHVHYFAVHPGQVASFWLGGLTWEGALAGALLILLLAKKIWQWSYFTLLDRLSLLILPVGVAVWLACLLSGTAYGQALPAGTWWGINTFDESGTLSLRLPVQPLAAISLVVFLGFTELVMRDSKLVGLKGNLLTLIFSADILIFTFLRADPSQTWLGLRFESWAAMVYTVIGITALLWILFKNGKLNSIIAFLRRIATGIKKLYETKPRTRTD